ncbi:PQQ-dependent sugar dehydrogenase [Tautonia plasticadhaerens]|uniref:Soluble aldose sugar dehydrogenase YliI n=1 Tax=Tautonia plasticadhaerens TaxID=2527974 RepID=A0A518HC59_9BACT|nr:PQQ-dependent sugar dehydrogenase [Tautonia plasticadhaerens]QDV38441.1 Soluble aldose sugar dehydrogenase YliI precursor [Tautonia plasticadhaerens]
MRSTPILALVPLLILPAPIPADDDGPVGLERRIPWEDSRVVGSPEPPLPYKTARAFPGLEGIEQPLAMFPEPGTDRLFLLQHLGSWAGPSRLLVVEDDQDARDPELLLEVNALSCGLAFHPDYEENGFIFLGMNGPDGGGRRGGPEKTTQAVRYTVDRETGTIDPDSRLLIIEWASNGHDGGDVAFGNDGMLYISSGDGSSGSDAHLTGQRIDDLLGSILRIDVDHPDAGRNYSVPPDNPFVDRPGARPEVWAYGLRNPWRLSFDAESGQLWAGNNGQDLWEQVYLVEKGANYGWSITEGMQIFQAQREQGPDPISPPAAEHHHSEARSLTGGRVYRGDRLPELVGTYLYGDWSTGKVWGIEVEDDRVARNRELVDTPFNITGFGTDHDGELYVIDHVSGFHRLEPTTAADLPPHPFPTLLSETGLFDSVAEHTKHPAALPYDVAAPGWNDGASMERFAAFPGLERIEQKPQKNAGGAWSLPNGSVLVQTLSLDVLDEEGNPAKTRIETRLMNRQQGEWTGYSYRWNAEQTDAELVPSSGDIALLEVPDPEASGGVREQAWRFPARTECLVCHSRAAGFVLGFSPLQLDRTHDYEGVEADQLRTFEHIGLFEGDLPERKADRPRLVDPYDDSADREARVRSYLHVNCSTCHVNEGGGNSRMEMALTTPARRMGLIGEEPMHTKFEIPDAKIVLPGDPERSILYQRISRRLTGQMPPLMSTEVDREAVGLIAEWIRSLPPSE